MPMPSPNAERSTLGRRSALATLTLAIFLGCVLPAYAQEPSDPALKVSLEDSPLEQALSALRRAEFERLRPLLSPFIDSDAFHALPAEERARARALLALGLYFESQALSDPALASELMAHVRAQLQVSVIEAPDHTLDPLVFPADLVALQRTLVRRLPLPGTASPSPEDSPLIYVERRITRRSPWVTLLPMGAGQFQNGHPIRGSVFAATQALGLAANLIGFWQVEAYRDRRGLIAAAAHDEARRWQTLQWTGLAVAALGWGLSVADALYHFDRTDVTLRTLDAPPPELEDAP
ncbi:hypothetical protein FRC98_08200 [Lujinxingia vulgaris]|uniref:Uncharacterized protein n=1 Tax=Lujinxingia vulgaris TaxID=2600176 RepID=A0A5C6XD22_9DELT|nr:hypothetical protein [Lujinxingia vulgaris]TXD37661.1 hypothetical protein FRC98_08200 [Lujinxingia vulgaris]